MGTPTSTAASQYSLAPMYATQFTGMRGPILSLLRVNQIHISHVVGPHLAPVMQVNVYEKAVRK
ncbi:hypothetical protein KY285_024574 [Solanum tuberosum]|nr:hypothetical protein KY285_024574 [Solanum tuberosum]